VGPSSVSKGEVSDWNSQTLRCTPSMEAGVTDRLLSFEDVVGIVDDWESAQKENA